MPEQKHSFVSFVRRTRKKTLLVGRNFTRIRTSDCLFPPLCIDSTGWLLFFCTCYVTLLSVYTIRCRVQIRKCKVIASQRRFYLSSSIFSSTLRSILLKFSKYTLIRNRPSRLMRLERILSVSWILEQFLCRSILRYLIYSIFCIKFCG